jgi:RHS repeat-associated protein
MFWRPVSGLLIPVAVTLLILESWGHTPIASAATIDLVTKIVSGPSSGTTGGNIIITNRVMNQGTATTGSGFNVGLYLSTDNVIEASDSFLGSRPSPPLGARGINQANTKVMVPSDLTLGTYFLGVCADSPPPGSIVESNELNNCKVGNQITIAAGTTTTPPPPPGPGPDLMMTIVSGPINGTTGGNIIITNRVVNQGTATTGSGFNVGLYLSSNNVIDTSDTFIGSRTSPALAEGGISQANTNVTIPSDIPLGTYYLGVCADDPPPGAIVESNELNNCKVGNQITIVAGTTSNPPPPPGPGPDLIMTIVSGPNKGATGGDIIITNRVVNQGTETTGSGFSVALYLSPDNIIDASDKVLGRRSADALPGVSLHLQPSNVSQGNTKVTIPSDLTPGKYFFGACADDTNVIVEADETNNCTAGNFIVIAAMSGVHSSVLSDMDNVYPTGSMIRIDVDSNSGLSDIVGGSIQITSASQGYDSGVQNLMFGSIFYMWDTTDLNPASDYRILATLTDASGQTTPDDSLTIALTPNPPAINKLVSDVDISTPANGFPVRVVRTYLLDSTFEGPLGYGWTHTYRMRAVETPTYRNNQGQLVPVDGLVQIFNPDGTGSYYQPNGDGTYRSPKGDFRTLTKSAEGTYLLKDKFGTQYDFDAIGRLIRITDRNGNVQTLGYGLNSRVATVTDPSGQVTRFVYNADNRISSITDPTGRVVSYDYDEVGNLIAVTNIGGRRTTYAYDANHNLTTITDPAGNRTFFTANTDDRLVTASGEDGNNEITFQYLNPTPNQMTVTDALGSQTVLTYNNNASVTSVVDPLGNTTSMAYGADLNMTKLTDAKDGVTTFSYDDRGNVLSTTDALGRSVSLAYDPSFNQVKSLTDARGNVTAFQYDGEGNLSVMTYPNGSSETFGYDATGNLISKTDRKGQTINYSYDTRGNLTAKIFPDGTSTQFTYDAAGNLIVAANGSGTIGFQYDSSDRLIQVNYPGGNVVSYAYDAAGNRTELTYPDGSTLDYSYDLANRLTQVSRSGQTVAQYAYDALSRVIRRDLENGTSTTYNYDASSRLLDLINRKSTSEIISRFSYTYDNLGNRLTMTTLDGTTRYSYDATRQLINVIRPDSSSTAYNFDAAGNRISVTDSSGSTSYTTNDLNQYTNVDGASYSYDANGNMTSKTTSEGTTTYSYDFENRLVQVVTPTETVNYTYDPLGRRVSKSTSSGTTNYIHDDFRVIEEKDESGASQASYIQGNGLDEVLEMNRAGQDYYYSQDGLGSVTGITDISQNMVHSFSYDEYGTPNSASSVGNPFLFTGREFEGETGLYFYRARYYDPKLGRFVASDPIGLNGGNNLYAYVENNPVNFIDPLGLQYQGEQEIGRWQGIACGTILSYAGGGLGGTINRFLGGPLGKLFGSQVGSKVCHPPGPAPENPAPPPPAPNPPAGNPGDQSSGSCVTIYDCDGDGIPDSQDPAPYDPDNPNPGGGLGKGEGNSWGDPHLVTFDGLAYDFQAVGEFILVRSLDDNFEIQTRTAPWRNSRVVSVNTAAAMNVAGDRIGIYVGRDPALYINGVPTSLLGSQSLPQGGQISFLSGTYTVTWPDGSLVRARVTPSYLDVKVLPRNTRQGRFQGLLGDFDAQIGNELVIRNGAILSSPVTFDELYKQYGESWRISQAESLFDYFDGQTTETYTDRTFPDSLVTTAVLSDSVRLQALQVCANAGVTDLILLDACILDVGLTGDSSFAVSAAAVTPPLDFVRTRGPISTGPIRWDVLEGGNGNLYEAVLVPDGISWTDANTAAQAKGDGWHLATITSSEENAFVFGLVGDNSAFWNCCIGNNSEGPWLGGYKVGPGVGDYAWVTNEPFSYTNWGPLEPFGNGDRIGLLGYQEPSGPYWNDVPASSLEFGYIIEKSETPGPNSGIWTGTYAWNCSPTNSGSSPLTLEITQYGDQLTGTASYLGDVTNITGSIDGDTIIIDVTATTSITHNNFTGTLSGQNISGTTLNGENCSAPTGPSGTFNVSTASVTAGPPSQLAIIGPSLFTTRSPVPFTVEVQDNSGNPSKALSDITVTLNTTGAGIFRTCGYFQGCSPPINSVVIPSGGMSQTVYLHDSTAEVLTLSVADSDNNLTGDDLIVNVTGVGGTITFDIDNVPVNHSNAATAYLASDSFTLISGFDPVGNYVQMFIPGSTIGTFPCGNLYYQDSTGEQWGAGGSIGGSCSFTITIYGAVGDPIEGTFSGILNPQFGGATGTRTITNGQFSVLREPGATPPNPPQNIHAVAGDGQVTVSWDAANGATSYNVYMASESGVSKSNYTTLTDGMKHAGVTSPFTQTGLVNGTGYYFVVTSVNSNGESGESIEVSGTPTSVSTGSLSFDAAANFGVGTSPQSSAVGDFNQDGKQDLAVANVFSNNVSILLGDGAESFGVATNYAVGGEPTSVAVGDFNEDGKLDLAVTNASVGSRNVSILLGDGAGSFGVATNFPVGANPLSIVVTDFDRDGKQDLAVANQDSNNVSILLGNGTGSFGAATNFDTGQGPTSLAVGDFNGDGKPDLAVANLNGVGNTDSVSILLGDGSGSFGAATNVAPGSDRSSVAVGDFNGDGKQDLAVVQFAGYGVLILLGDGAGSFGETTNFALSGTYSVIVGDFNGDGRQDLAATTFNDTVSVLLGNGAGSFGAPIDFAVGAGPWALSVGDFNRDGKADLSVTNQNSNNVSILLNTTSFSPSGTFGPATNFAVGSFPESVAVAEDFNRDGRLDLSVANSGSHTVSVLLGNGTGALSTATDFVTGSVPRSVAAGDLNRDGKLDLAVANSGGEVSILTGSGDGTFEDAIGFEAGNQPISVATGDFNRDGRLDLAVANFSDDSVSVLLGDGVGSFGIPADYAVGEGPYYVAIDDLNGDGKLDLAVANLGPTQNGNTISILLGDGTGSFGAATSVGVGTGPTSVTTGDFNRDGRLDLAVANSTSNNVSILLGDGTGAFGEPTNFTAGSGPFVSFAAVGDFNRDGKLDLAVANLGSSIISILLGNGLGSFGAPNDFAVGNGPVSVTIGDFNRDGKSDLAVSNRDSNTVSILLNQPVVTPSSTIISLAWEGQITSVSGGTAQQQSALADLGVVAGATANGSFTIDTSTPGQDVPSLPERKSFEGAVINMNTTIGGWSLENIRPGYVDIDVSTFWMFRARSDCCPGSAGAVDSPDIIVGAEDISFSMVSSDPNFLPQTLVDTVPNLVDAFPSSSGADAHAVDIFDANGVQVWVTVAKLQ